MRKKTCCTITVLTFALLLTVPAFGDSSGSAANPATSGVARSWAPRFDAWLQSLMAWIEEALRETESQASVGSRGGSGLDHKPEKPEPSDPGTTLVPMGGPDGDPNG